MNRKLAIGSVIASVFAVIALCASLLSVSIPKTAQAEQLLLFRNVSIGSWSNYSGTVTNTLPTFSVYYGSADCFVTYVSGTAIPGASFVTATVKLQASQDAVYWADLTSYAAIITPSTVLTRTPLYGNYIRAYMTPGTNQPVTTTVNCKLVQTNY